MHGPCDTCSNVADSTDSRYVGDLWTLDIALRGLPLVCKVGLSLIVDNVLEFGKYFRFILQGGGEGSGMAQSLYTVRCWTTLVLLIFDFSNGWF